MVLLLVWPLLCAGSAWADGLYQGRTIVTGMDGRSRPDGLTVILGRVLAKVSGNPALAKDARLAHVDPAPLVRSFAYLDRMSDQPKHDEQGTRDRPYDLVASFDPAGIDALLRRWGEHSWPLPRPVLVVDVRIEPQRGPAMWLRADTDADERHRASLLDAAERFGLDVVIPDTAGTVRNTAGWPVLEGAMAWSDAAAGWVGEWRLAQGGPVRVWRFSGVSFDAAYRAGMGGAARVLSGHQ